MVFLNCESCCIRGILLTWMSKNLAGSQNTLVSLNFESCCINVALGDFLRLFMLGAFCFMYFKLLALIFVPFVCYELVFLYLNACNTRRDNCLVKILYNNSAPFLSLSSLLTYSRVDIQFSVGSSRLPSFHRFICFFITMNTSLFLLFISPLHLFSAN